MARLKSILQKRSGRAHGVVVVRHQGGGHKKFLREVDFKRGKINVWVKLPSGEIRRFYPEAMASIGQVGNIHAKDEIIGKAGRNRHKGIRPSVRGVAMHPDSHPHGGGEGRSGIGMKSPKTVYGRKAVGKTRNKTKYSNYLIVQRRGGKAVLG